MDGFGFEQRWLGASHVGSTLGALAEAASAAAGGFVVRLWAEQIQNGVSEVTHAFRADPFAGVATSNFDGRERARQRHQVGTKRSDRAVAFMASIEELRGARVNG